MSNRLITDLKRSVDRLLRIPDDCGEICYDAEEIERKHRQAEYQKALEAIEKSIESATIAHKG